MDDVEQDLILQTLGHTLGNRTHAATLLGISIRALRNKLRDYTAIRHRRAAAGQRPGTRHGGLRRVAEAGTAMGGAWLDRLRAIAPGTDVGLALGVIALLSVLVLPLPTMLLDLGLALSVVAAVLVLMVALFLHRPLDFTSFPTLLLLTTLLRLSLNVATTRG